jgi:hypothetical protein
VQGDWSIRVVGLVRAGALTQLCLDLPDGVIQVLDQEIKQGCQTAGLHFGDDLEGGFASIKLINNLHAGHSISFKMRGRVWTLPWMFLDLVTRTYRQLIGQNMSPFGAWARSQPSSASLIPAPQSPETGAGKGRRQARGEERKRVLHDPDAPSFLA